MEKKYLYFIITAMSVTIAYLNYFREPSFINKYTTGFYEPNIVNNNHECVKKIFEKKSREVEFEHKGSPETSKSFVVQNLLIGQDNTNKDASNTYTKSVDYEPTDKDSNFLTDNEAVHKAINELTLHGKNNDNVSIKWSVDTNNIFLTNGEISDSITLLATLSKNEIMEVKEFKFSIQKPSSHDIVNNIYNNLKFESINTSNATSDYVISDLNLPDMAEYNSSITWTSSNENIISRRGTVERPSFNENSETVTLTATINNNGIETKKEFYVTVPPDDSAIRKER